MKKILSFLILILSQVSVCAQDKDAEAKMHYINAEEYFNKETLLGAVKCVKELKDAETALENTNPKILYLKIKAGEEVFPGYYRYDMVGWLRDFFRLTDVKTFPEDKYTEILKINKGYAAYVNDTAFERKVRIDSSFIKKVDKTFTPMYKHSLEGMYNLGKNFVRESFIATPPWPKKVDGSIDEGYREAYYLFSYAASKGHKESMTELSHMYYDGNGISKDDLKALEWAIKANDSGQISFLYRFAPANTIIDGQKVIDWCIIAANSNDTSIAGYSMQTIGKIYDKGLGGVIKDTYKALEWYIKSYEKDKDARSLIYMVYHDNYYEKDRAIQKKVSKMYLDWSKNNKRN